MTRIEQLNAFLQESPGDAFLIHALALEHVKANEDEKAKEYFMQNKTYNPTYVATYYHFGKLLERIESESMAIAIYKAGMEVAAAAGDHHAFSELRSVYEELLY